MNSTKSSTAPTPLKSHSHFQIFATSFWHFQSFQIKIRHVQTFATKICHLQTFATKKLRRDFSDQCGSQRDPAAQETARPARPKIIRPIKKCSVFHNGLPLLFLKNNQKNLKLVFFLNLDGESLNFERGFCKVCHKFNT